MSVILEPFRFTFLSFFSCFFYMTSLIFFFCFAFFFVLLLLSPNVILPGVSSSFFFSLSQMNRIKAADWSEEESEGKEEMQGGTVRKKRWKREAAMGGGEEGEWERRARASRRRLCVCVCFMSRLYLLSRAEQQSAGTRRHASVHTHIGRGRRCKQDG